MASSGANYRLFWQEFRRTFHSTGAVLPSGPRLCRALARYVSGDGRPRRILEVGPGTGVVTHEIISQLGPHDTLDIVELNDRFVDALRQRLEREQHWRAVAQRVQIHHMPVEQLSAAEPYDAIVSGLPLNNFPADLVRSLLSHFERLAAPDATLSFFEYVAVRTAKGLVAKGAERQRLSQIGAAIADACGRYEFRKDMVMLNVPPAWVHHLRFSAADAA